MTATATATRVWALNETGTHRHFYTDRCRGCCSSQATHTRTYVPRSLCGKSWLSHDGQNDPSARPQCGPCKRLAGGAQ